MGKINVLDKHVAELIAAGEVVERPASAVKELVENCVDAEAKNVTVEIRGGGISFLRVTDDGCGIERGDVPLAFLRHATSKISGGRDLDAIATLGFRGEALASIAAVAHVELLTRTADELAGTRYAISGGQEESCEDAGCAEGTTIVVRDLFYNTPARMKFLKKDFTEGNAVAGIVEKEALAHPEISFRFLRDGKETLHTPGDGQLRSAVYAVFGKEFTAGLMPLRYELNGITAEGFVSRPDAARPNRSMQNFFINGRYVKSRTASVALEEGFRGSLMVGKIPACVLHLTVPFAAVDVNVHPAKIEVRFLNERPIFDAVYHGVKSALQVGDTPHMMRLADPAAPVFRRPEPPAVQMRLDPSPYRGAAPQASAVTEFTGVVSTREEIPARSSRFPAVRSENVLAMTAMRGTLVAPDIERDDEPVAQTVQAQPGPDISPAQEAAAPQQEVPRASELQERLVGEAFSTYIIVQRGDNLIFIDKHAAHERMLYEKLKSKGGKACCQMLLEPVAVSLSKEEYSAVLNSLQVCEDAGFEIEDFGTGTVLVRSAPMILEGDVAQAVMEIAGYLASSRTDVTTEKLDWLYHNVACRAAVKAGDPASPQELLDLVHRVEREDIRYCPHGRPVLFVLTRKELERQFGRLQ